MAEYSHEMRSWLWENPTWRFFNVSVKSLSHQWDEMEKHLRNMFTAGEDGAAYFTASDLDVCEEKRFSSWRGCQVSAPSSPAERRGWQPPLIHNSRETIGRHLRGQNLHQCPVRHLHTLVTWNVKWQAAGVSGRFTDIIQCCLCHIPQCSLCIVWKIEKKRSFLYPIALLPNTSCRRRRSSFYFTFKSNSTSMLPQNNFQSQLLM